MAHGFVSYSQPKYGLDLGAMVAGKIKDSFGMAAEERRLRDEEIAKLEGKNKEDRTAEESKRLEELLEQKKSRTEGRKRDRIKNSFFTKAMMSQFGGDRARRLQGMVSSSPRGSQDPSLTKEQRYSALLDESMAAPGEGPSAPDDIDPMDYGDANAQAPTPQQTGLEKALGRVSEALSIISSKVSSLKAEEAKSKTTTESRLAKFTGVFESIKNYFDRDNDLKKTENNIEQQKIENFRDAQADAKAARERSSIGQTEDLSVFEDMEERPGGEGKGLLGGLMDGVKGLFKNFMGGGKKGAAKGVTGYSKPIGPQPMNSSSPWARMGAGDRGGMFGQGQFTPRLSSTKLSEGGIITKPTTGTLQPGSSVIPLNRNNAVADTFQKAKESAGDASVADPMAQVMQLPSQVGGGLLIGLLSKAMSALGGIAGMLKPVIQPVLNTLVPAFGLPATVAGAIFGGGPAQAATGDFDLGSYFGMKESKGPGAASSGGTTGGTPVVPTGAVSAAPKGNETGILSLSGGTPTALAQGSTIANTQLHHGHEDNRRGLKVRDYFIGGAAGPSDGSDGLGARLYTPLGFGPVKYKKLDNHGITFHDPQTDEKVGMYYHVNDPQHQLDGQIVQPGTLVGTQGGLPGTSSAYPGSSAVHLHVEGTERFHNAVISTYASGHVLNAPGVTHTATQQNPQPAGARPQLGAANTPVTTAGATPQHQGPVIAPIPALAAATQTQEDAPIDSSSPFSIQNQTPGWGSMYGQLIF